MPSSDMHLHSQHLERERALPSDRGYRSVDEERESPVSRDFSEKSQSVSHSKQIGLSPSSLQPKELFPEISKNPTLPEKATESVHFDRSFLHSKENEPLLDYSLRMGYRPEEYSQFEKDLMNSDAGLTVKIANDIINMRLEEQLDLFQGFKRLNDKLRFLREKKAKALDEIAKNAKLIDYWDTIKTNANYAAIGMGAVAGAVEIGCGLSSGDGNLLQLGLLSILGACGNAGAVWMGNHGYNDKVVTVTSVASSLASGYGAVKPLNLPGLIGTIMGYGESLFKIGGVASNALSNHKTAECSAKNYEIQAQTTQYKFFSDKNKSKQSKYLGAMKLTEMIDEIDAASKQLANEDRLKEQIALISSPAA